MQDWMTRLRAALTPRVVLLLVAAMLLLSISMGRKKKDDHDNAAVFEKRIERTLSEMAGAGRVNVVLHMKRTGEKDAQSQPAVSGVIAVVQGGDDPIVCLNIQEALCALLGLPASAVSVVSGG